MCKKSSSWLVFWGGRKVDTGMQSFWSAACSPANHAQRRGTPLGKRAFISCRVGWGSTWSVVFPETLYMEGFIHWNAEGFLSPHECKTDLEEIQPCETFEFEVGIIERTVVFMCDGNTDEIIIHTHTHTQIEQMCMPEHSVPTEYCDGSCFVKSAELNTWSYEVRSALLVSPAYLKLQDFHYI